MNHSYWAVRATALRDELMLTRKAMWRAHDRYAKLQVVALAGWVLLVAVLVWPNAACASEQYTSILIRCQQGDTCLKRELVYPTEAACDAANERVVADIGKTNDIVVAYCVGGDQQ